MAGHAALREEACLLAPPRLVEPAQERPARGAQERRPEVRDATVTGVKETAVKGEAQQHEDDASCINFVVEVVVVIRRGVLRPGPVLALEVGGRGQHQRHVR